MFLDLRKTRIVKGLGLTIAISLAERVRASRGTPQAVVKVISYGHGLKAVGRTVDYISRAGALALETESGDLIPSREEQKALVRNWSRDFDTSKTGRDAVHIAFSMPRGSDPEALQGAARSVLSNYFSGHEFVFAIHQDRPHPHAHAIVKMRSRETGKKLRLNRTELYKLREAFAEAAREHGVELAVSPRAARGVGQKGLRQVIYQLHRKGIVPRVEKETVRELMEPGGLQEKIWERAMLERNEKERKAYREEGARVRAAAAQEDPKTREALLMAAADLERFARTMPKPKTKRQVILEKIRGVETKTQHPSQERSSGNER